MTEAKEDGIFTGKGKWKWPDWLAVATSTGCFVGYVPGAPGTWGSLLAVLLYAWIGGLPLALHIVLCVTLCIAGLFACRRTEQLFRSHDSSRIVMDEIVGMLVTMIGIPITGYWLAVAFLVFRFFDVVKFPPCNYLDKHVRNEWGVMFDDVVAGVYGNILLQLMLRAKI